MKIFSLSALFFASGLALSGCYCGGPGSGASLAAAAEPNVHTDAQPESVQRDYLVKGMTCGGCVYGVKKALGRAGVGKDQIVEVAYNTPDPEHQIGHAMVKFSKDQYKGQATDCKIVKEIRQSPGYIAYWDAANTDPCDLEKTN